MKFPNAGYVRRKEDNFLILLNNFPFTYKIRHLTIFKHIPPLFRNKYLLALICFMIWMLFFDDRDFITTHFRHPNELKQLEKSKLYYQEQIRIIRSELDQLRSHTGTIEKYAREKYNMKRENEDLFIIEPAK